MYTAMQIEAANANAVALAVGVHVPLRWQLV
jgi:hypothetical protein